MSLYNCGQLGQPRVSVSNKGNQQLQPVGVNVGGGNLPGATVSDIPPLVHQRYGGNGGYQMQQEGNIITKNGVVPISEALRQGIINLDQLSGREFAQIKGKLKRVRDDTLYDGFRIKGAATVWAKGDYTLFAQAVSAASFVVNDSTLNFTKTRFDTNLKGPGGQMTPGIAYVVQSIQFKIIAPTLEDTTPLLNGSAISPVPVAAASPAIINSSNLIAAITESVGFTFTVDDTDYENGPINTWPSDKGLSGAYGGGIQEGFTQLGMGRARHLTRVRHLEPGQRFSVVINVYNDITITRSCRLKCDFDGARYAPVS